MSFRIDVRPVASQSKAERAVRPEFAEGARVLAISTRLAHSRPTDSPLQTKLYARHGSPASVMEK